MQYFKTNFAILFLLITVFSHSQIAVIEGQTPEQLVRDVLLQSSCATTENWTASGGFFFNPFNKSYAKFSQNNSTFPFQNGVVLVSGQASRVPGPNTGTLSVGIDSWLGDPDLENALGTINTFNAAILEFDFIPLTTKFSFNYIFASEEYENNYPCQYSDGFAFLLKPANNPAAPYVNLAKIPNLNIPVSSTSIRPTIPGPLGCAANNETYFAGYNNQGNSPINFNGQTKVLKASADVIPGQKYHIKLVVADQRDSLYDSAIFIEGGSFNIGVNLGENLTFATGNPVCGNGAHPLDATTPGQNTYKWFKNDIEIQNETAPIYNAVSNGTYRVDVSLGGTTCVISSSIIIEFAAPFNGTPQKIAHCDTDLDLVSQINLKQVENNLVPNPAVCTFNYYTSQIGAQTQNATLLIANPSSFTANNGTEVWVRVANRYNCIAVVKISIGIAATQLPANYSQNLSACDDFIDAQNNDKDGITGFNLTLATNNLLTVLPIAGNFEIKYYRNQNDFEIETDATGASLAIDNLASYRNTGYANQQTIWLKVISTLDNTCFGYGKIFLKVEKVPALANQKDLFICSKSNEVLTISSGLIGQEVVSNYRFKWFLDGAEILGLTTSAIEITATGLYTCEIKNIASGCIASSSQVVKEIEPPTKVTLNIKDLTANNLVVATATGTGVFEYAVDIPAGFYQSSPVFENVSPGFHVFFARNILGCEPLTVRFAVVGIMPFFTPNQDSFNDFWRIEGISKQFNLQSKVQIYDRFGRLLYEMQSGDDQGWDGMLNGKPLPADDYWYTLTLQDGRVSTGHFSLKR